ncbi:hypothetical protein ANN_19792, partial [Periplaneta americana]
LAAKPGGPGSIPVRQSYLVEVLPPLLRLSVSDLVTVASDLVSGKSDILVGTLPLLPVVISSDYEPSIPFKFGSVSWFVPCPESLRRIEKVFTTYTASVWATMTVVYISISCVFWWSANKTISPVAKDSINFRFMNLSLYNAWGIFLGVSVPEMPNSWKLRMIFLLYVCYSFVISTVFQAFFTSYLVEPGYGKKLETLDDVLKSNLKFGFNSAVELAASTMDYREIGMFSSSRRVECSDLKKCLERIIYKRDITTIAAGVYNYTENNKIPASRSVDCNDMVNCMKKVILVRDVATISAPKAAHYTASTLGLNDETRAVCFLEERLIFAGSAALLSKGSPLLPRLNTYIRRTFEGGLADKLWGETKHIAILTSEKRTSAYENKLKMSSQFNWSVEVGGCSLESRFAISTPSLYSLQIQLVSERIPNLSADQSDGITVFRISAMTSLMLHREMTYGNLAKSCSRSTITTCTATMIAIEPSSSFVPIPLQRDVIDSLMLAGNEFQSLGRAIVKEDEYEEVRWDGIVSIVSWRERVFRLWWEESLRQPIASRDGVI